ncbi:MAG: ferredoxin [Planctomycetaceae bacterium]|nr:ferredoxin [Planctomycetaceae bacterium]MBP60943.1 ferredoxin [Planctomycetaceae bacterium]
MAPRLTVVISQGQSQNPAKMGMEEEIVAQLLGEPGVDVTVIPHLYDLDSEGTGVLCLQGVTGDMVVLGRLFPRAIRWILDRHGVFGHAGTTLLEAEDEEEDEDQQLDGVEAKAKQRVIDTRQLPDRRIYCIDLRARPAAEAYVEEVRRIVQECQTSVVELSDWIQGDPKPEHMQKYLSPGTALNESRDATNRSGIVAGGDPTRIEEQPSRRWYPVIDYSRCTNCMECIDFCLFGVYGVDNVETILVEQPDNCRKGCPACSRVCPENAIMFPQHRTPGIAGDAEAVGGLKIDLSRLFGKPDDGPLDAAVRERDEQLELAGRDAVGRSTGIPRRRTGTQQRAKDVLDDLMDEVDAMDL